MGEWEGSDFSLKFSLKDVVLFCLLCSALLFCSSLFRKWFFIIHDLRCILDVGFWVTVAGPGLKEETAEVVLPPSYSHLVPQSQTVESVRNERLLWHFLFCFEAPSHFEALYYAPTYKINLYPFFTLKGLPVQLRGRQRWGLCERQRSQPKTSRWNPHGTDQFTVSTTYLNKVFISRIDFSQFYAFPLECFSL